MGVDYSTGVIYGAVLDPEWFKGTDLYDEDDLYETCENIADFLGFDYATSGSFYTNDGVSYIFGQSLISADLYEPGAKPKLLEDKVEYLLVDTALEAKLTELGIWDKVGPIGMYQWGLVS